MADAKISITTEAKNDGLEKLQHALAEGQQAAASLTKALRDMEKATDSGTRATQEQREIMVSLRQTLNQQKADNAELGKAIKKTTSEIEGSVRAMADGDKGARGLASAFKLTEGFTTAFSVALGNLATSILTGVVSAIGDMAGQVISLGAQMQQSVAQMGAMVNVTGDATEAYRALNDVYRNTNFEESAVQQMGIQLMNMGYSAQNAAAMIQLCADASAGLGSGQQGAQQLVEAISRMQAVGELTSRQLTQLKMAGVDVDAAFKSLGMTGDEAMKAVKEGTLDSQKAIDALTQYLHQYDGKMAESKNNTIDAWGDVTGNMQTFCAEIGAGIFDAFNQSEIVQELIDFTQSLVDMVRGEGCGAFSDLKAVAGEVLDFIGGLLGFVLDTIKLIILILDEAYSAFKSFGAQVVDAIRPAVDVVLALYDAVKAVMSSIGKNFGAEVGRSWKKTFGPDPDDPGNQKVLGGGGNNFRQRSYGGGGRSGGGGGGGGGSAKAQLSEEEKAVEALIKKYSDAEKQKQELAKSTLELAKVNTGMLVGEAKAAQEKQDKLNELKVTHDQLMDGYAKELILAGKITDAGKRDKAIDGIMAQIRAEKDLYDAKVQAAEWGSNFSELQKNSKSMVDLILGDTDQSKQKIEKIKTDLTNLVQSVNAAMAMPLEEDQLSGMAKILNVTPEELAEDLAARGQSLEEFANKYIETHAKMAAADIASVNSAKSWSNYIVGYATNVGKSMGDAFYDWITGAKTASQALKDFVQGLIQNAVKLLAQWVGVYLTLLAFGLYDPHQASLAATKIVLGVGEGGKTVKEMCGAGGSVSVGSYAGHATGGYITGPGTGTSDSIPAMLSNGEYVIRSAAVDRIGVGTLNAINSGRVPHFAEGGSVDGTEAEAAVAGGSVTFNISAVDAESFSGFLERGGLDSIKQALYEDNRRFASSAGVW